MSKKVLVALSGGVDSSVACALLKEQGYFVEGAYMKNFSEESFQGKLDLHCPWREDLEIVQQVANHLEIPIRTFNFEKEYKQRVIDYFFDEYKKGRTPNPDVLCNNLIKFDLFLKEAKKLNFDFIATGHYARIERNENYEFENLKRGIDKNKDQSYFLNQLKKEQLESVLLPIGEYTKPEIRKLAQKFDLPNKNRPDSQGICFIGEIDMFKFLQSEIPVSQGDVIDKNNNKIGTHQGVQFYTLGQRHGFESSGKGPYYIYDKNITNNILHVTNDQNDPLLFKKEFTIEKVNWINNKPKSSKLNIQTRYRQTPVNGRIDEQHNKVILDQPVRTPTPGQFAAFYHNDLLLGGAVIKQ